MATYKDIERTSVNRSRCDDDLMPMLAALASKSQEGRLQEDGPALKPQPRKRIKSFKPFSSSDFHHITLKRVVTEEDTTSGSEDDYRDPSFESEHDSRESSLGLTVEGNSSGSEDGSEDSHFLDVPTTFRRTSRLTLRMRPMLTSNLLSNSTFYEGETSYQPQLLSREVSVDTLNHESSVLVTPRLYQSSAGLLSPPPAPRQIERKEDIISTSVPKELCLPMLY
jgi:hypothetical protein